MTFRARQILIGAVIVTIGMPLAAHGQSAVFPGADWQRKAPAELGINPQLLKEAIDFSIASEIKNPRDLKLNHYQTFGRREPFGEAIGPIKDRGDLTGIIVHKGVIVAEWGEPHRVDMTHSVTKSFLSSVVGLAFDAGMIRNVDDTAREYVAPIQLYNPNYLGSNRADRMGAPDLIDLFDTPHNRTVTWNSLLRQTSDWEGTLWGKPDWADRPGDKPGEWLTRPRNRPGTAYKYNDTRVNVLALAALNLWRRPLPQVLKERIMDPIGASSTWRWFGYDNAWVVIDGQPMQSSTGGGMFISTYDMARLGLLTLHRGKWNGRQLLSEKWIGMALTPTGLTSPYGFMNYQLNADRKPLPSAPPTAFMHTGNGLNMVYVDPEHDLVAVVRWIENGAADGFVKRLIAAVTDKSVTAEKK
jgi:CubicO group peptidase (beta-lactamase class C family)